MRKSIEIGGLAVNERIIYTSGNGRSSVSRTPRWGSFTFWMDGKPIDYYDDEPDGGEWSKAASDANGVISLFCEGLLAAAIAETPGKDAKEKTVKFIKDNYDNKVYHLVVNEWLNGIDKWHSSTTKAQIKWTEYWERELAKKK